MIAAAACLWLAGCATSEDVATNTGSPSEREYPTGSNIPRKSAQRNPSAEGVRVHSREDLERIQSMGNGVPQRGSGLSP
jgi:hypothetical protein